MVSVDDLLFYIDDALDGMVAIVEELGDERATQCLDTPGANSPYALLVHCLGVIEYWAGFLIGDRDIERDRDAEFRAFGSVADLVERTRRAREQLRVDLASLEPSAPTRRPPIVPEDADLAYARTQGGALVHIYEELAQHRGQMEVTRDVLLAPWAKLA